MEEDKIVIEESKIITYGENQYKSGLYDGYNDGFYDGYNKGKKESDKKGYERGIYVGLILGVLSTFTFNIVSLNIHRIK